MEDLNFGVFVAVACACFIGFVFLIIRIIQQNPSQNTSKWTEDIMAIFRAIHAEIGAGKEEGFSMNIDGTSTHIVIDFETANLSRSWDSVASVGVSLVYEGKIVGSAYTLAQPRVAMEEGASRVNGLTDEMLSQGPDVEGVLGALCVLLNCGLPIVSYNNFDLEILESFKRYSGVDLDNVPLHIDAMLLATEVYTPGQKWLKLKEACKKANVSLVNAHNALSDANATALLMKRISDLLKTPDGPGFNIDHTLTYRPFA